MIVIKWIKYLKERVRFALHNSESIRRLLKKNEITEIEFQYLFSRMIHLECPQMQVMLIIKNKVLVDKMIKDMEENCSKISIPEKFDSKHLLKQIFIRVNKR